MFKIIVNCGPCAAFIDQCLKSIQSQSLDEWEAFVTCDPCGDDTFARALTFTTDSRIMVRLNATRQFSLRNQVQAIRYSGKDPDDIIVTLDGDDWFSRIDALKIIDDTYKKYDCWMTYGSWYSTTLSDMGEMWPAYPDGLIDFRGHRWLATAIRTWKRWLWQRIDDNDLRDAHGEYFRVAEDRAIMLPMLEMSGTKRAVHISEPLMIYNQSLDNMHPELETEGLANLKLIHDRPPYVQL